MKIGIEASRLTEKQRTGTENYLFNLVRKFSVFDVENEFILYFREEPEQEFWNELSSANPRFSYKVVKKFVSWTQVSLALEILRDAPDVLLCPWHTIPAASLFGKTRVVSAFHDATGRFLPSFWTAHFSDKLIAVSQRTCDEVSRRFGLSSVKKEKVSVIYEGVNEDLRPADSTEILRVRQKYGISEKYILFLGSVGPRKNLENMVAAFGEEIEFVIAGKVIPGGEKLTQLPAKFIGRVEDGDLAGLYSGAEFLASASQEEGFGLPVLEAQACGLPVLTSDIKVMHEVAGDAAIFVNPNDVESIRKGMEKLLSDSSIKKELVKKGFENVKRFSWEKCAREVLKEVADAK